MVLFVILIVQLIKLPTMDLFVTKGSIYMAFATAVRFICCFIIFALFRVFKNDEDGLKRPLLWRSIFS